MIKHETITVSGTVLYCDECGKRGPESAYDNVSDTVEQAEMMGWTTDDKDRDLCGDCTKKKVEAAEKPRAAKAAKAVKKGR